jgi:hypothetical protein
MGTTQRGLLLALGAVGFVSGLAASGCLASSALVCTAGTQQCIVTCVDFSSDEANCGSCGNPCQPRAVCVNSQCACPGTLTTCAGACTDVTTDPRNCGGCGQACASGLVCQPTVDGGLQSGTCQAVCGTGVECSGSCVTLDSDPANCGSCGNVCHQGYGCHATPLGPAQGACMPDVVVSCISAGVTTTVGSVAPLQDNPVRPVYGPFVAAGTVPGALGIFSDALLVGDEGVLRELALGDLSTVAPETTPLGLGPNFIEVDSRSATATWVYVVNSSSNTLSVLGGPPVGTARTDGGSQGLGLSVSGGYAFGPNTFPEPYARVGNELFVPLYGGFDDVSALVGGKVIRLDVSNPSVPVLVGIYDLNQLVILPTFDAGVVAYPRPSQALYHGGYVYVVLNNLDIDYVAAGPSVLAKIDPTLPLADGGAGDAGMGSLAGTVTLDPSVCLDAVAMANTDQRLLLSCFGQATFDSSFNTVAVDRSGVLLLDVNDALISSWSPQCPDAGAPCTPPIAGRLAVFGTRAYVGDQSSGRVFVLNVSVDGQLSELAGYTTDGGPLQPCPTGQSNVSDVIRIP